MSSLTSSSRLGIPASLTAVRPTLSSSLAFRIRLPVRGLDLLEALLELPSRKIHSPLDLRPGEILRLHAHELGVVRRGEAMRVIRVGGGLVALLVAASVGSLVSAAEEVGHSAEAGDGLGLVGWSFGFGDGRGCFLGEDFRGDFFEVRGGEGAAGEAFEGGVSLVFALVRQAMDFQEVEYLRVRRSRSTRELPREW